MFRYSEASIETVSLWRHINRRSIDEEKGEVKY
jgi:hypothetical protein